MMNGGSPLVMMVLALGERKSIAAKVAKVFNSGA